MFAPRPKLIGVAFLLTALLGAQVWTTVDLIDGARGHYADQIDAERLAAPGADEARADEPFDDWVMWRAGIVSAAFGLVLFGVGGLVVMAARRQTDLEERLDQNQLINELNAKADAILDAIPVGVMVIDHEGQIQDANTEMTAWLGPDAIGRPLEQAWRAATSTPFDALAELVEEEARLGRPCRQLLEDVELRGDRIDLQVEAVPLLAGKASAAMVLVFEDVTELIEMEEQLLRTEKLATVGILAAGIAHEIGTPLGVIQGRAEYARAHADDPEKVADSLEIVDDQVDYVRRIVRQVLDFSRETEAEVQATDLRELVDATLPLVDFGAKGERIRLETHLPDDMPPLAANPDNLKQVLLNLLLNAVDACDGEGTVRLVAEPHTDAETDEVDSLVVAVEDTGSGIPESNLHKIFDPFFTTKKRGKGTGLGLAIVARIVRAHGGHIDVASTPGEMTRFEIRWPVHRDEPRMRADQTREEETDDRA